MWLWLEKWEIKLPEGDKEKIEDDIRLYGTGWVYVTEEKIGERIDPLRVTIKPEKK